MRGAGGTSGGIGEFLLGFVMMCGGFYLLLQNITVRSHFGFGTALFRLGGAEGGGLAVTTGMILVPLIIGVFLIFYNARNYIGWALAVASLSGMLFGVVSSLQINLRSMTAFELIAILVLAFGGLGLFLRSLRDAGR